MKKSPIFALPFPSSAIVQGPALVDDERGLTLSITCADDDGRPRSSTIVFKNVRAYRRREETYCAAWHVQDTFDTMCEVIDSEWVEELRRDSVPEWRDKWVLRHFMIFLDGFGSFEVVAESASLEAGSSDPRNSGGT